jgi:chromosome segregation ATPase
MEGPVELSDLGIVLTKSCPRRDLDLIGRENAERSNDIKIALAKGWIKTIRKDASAREMGSVNPQVVQQLQEATRKVSEATANQAEVLKQLEDRNRKMEDLEERNRKLEQSLQEQKGKQDEILAEVRAFAGQFPLGIQTIKDAMKNAQAERTVIAAEKEKMSAADTDADLKAQARILEAKDKKLEKNIDHLGKTVSKSAEDMKDVMDAMDELNI